ncbi:VOC family protein [Amnibacterium setariae]|uniref:VOC family protein n=1 Tax=Amnibacterium setariae TaxID=2306585 RepID=A0A3A1U4U3_9MICO|nr:VOC family protein [Amnibacterium setariae]
MLRFATHLWFDHEAVEAAEFYADLVPDSHVDRVVAAPPGVPGAAPGAPFFVDLTLNGQQYTFLNGGPLFPFDSQVSLLLLVDTQAEVDRYWSALVADGGKEVQCGWLTDRFGLSWQVVPEALERLMADEDPAVRERVAKEMLGQVKFDVAALERAARG